MQSYEKSFRDALDVMGYWARKSSRAEDGERSEWIKLSDARLSASVRMLRELHEDGIISDAVLRSRIILLSASAVTALKFFYGDSGTTFENPRNRETCFTWETLHFMFFKNRLEPDDPMIRHNTVDIVSTISTLESIHHDWIQNG